jgi:gluconokinase
MNTSASTTSSVNAPVVVVMGVSGSGKSSIGEALAARLHWAFQEGDALHPAANIAKMSAGIALTDADREPWLDAIASWIGARLHAGEAGVVTCSALRRIYRDRLRQAGAGVRFVYPEVAREELERRMRTRQHFMPPSLLDSQLQTLEPPTADEQAIVLDAATDIDGNVTRVIEALSRQGTLSAPR